jgi:uncharacterized protein with HEPN domain
VRAELDYLRLIHHSAWGLEALSDPGSLPPDVVRDAAARRAEIIGEAYRTLERDYPAFATELTTRVPEVDWRGWYRFRNVLAHQVLEVDHQIVADAARNDAPVLRRGLEREFGAELVPAPHPEPAAQRQREDPQSAGRQTYDPELLDFCYRRRGLQPGEHPTEQDILVYNWVRAPKRINPRLAAARSLGRERRAILRRERGGGS